MSCSPKASASCTGGTAGTSVYYSVSVTNYAVTIRGDHDESFHKEGGPQPVPLEDIPVTRVSNNTDVLTPRFGDTFVDPSAANAQDPFTGIYRYWFGFTGEAIGFSANPTVAWNLRGANSSAWNHETHWVDFAPMDLAALSDNPSQRVVTLRLTDPGGISADATYTLRIHHPYEKWHKIGELNDVGDQVADLSPESPGVAYAHGSIHCTWNNPGPFWKLLSVAITVGSADIGGSLWKYFFKAAGIGATDLGPKPDGGIGQGRSFPGTRQATRP